VSHRHHHLKAHPQITVEYGTETFTADVTEMPADEGQASCSRRPT